MIQPNITHLPCDLNQQRERIDARRDSIARRVARRGRRSLLDRILRRAAPPAEVSAEDLRAVEGEDVFHSFRV